MKKLKILIPVILLSLYFAACRKDKPHITPNEPAAADILEKKDVKGMVYNLCTDGGLGGITVYLEIYKEKDLIFKTSQVSDEQGFFTFPQVGLHSSSLFKHSLYIPSKSGIGAKNKETCGIMGGSLAFSVLDADKLLQPRVIPSFIYIAFYFPRQQVTTGSDSIIARFAQNTYHKNVPDYPYTFGDGSIGTQNGYTGHTSVGNYPMGLYHIVVDKWVSGVHTQWKDSLFTNYGDTAAYVVHW